jgi:hypothetical protein
VNGYIDLFVEKSVKSAGRRKKREEIALMKEDKQKRIAAINEIGRLTSGKLACIDHYCLTDDVILRKAEEQYNNEIAAKQKSEMFKKNRQQKSDEKAKEAFRKYSNNENLRNDDYRALLKRVQQPDDSPIRTKTKELEQQFNIRKRRLDDMLFVVPQNNSIDDSIDALLALSNFANDRNEFAVSESTAI